MQISVSQLPKQFEDLFLAQLQLLWRLCQNNEDFIEALQTESGAGATGVSLKFDLIMSCLRDKRLERRQPRVLAKMIMLVQGKL